MLRTFKPLESYRGLADDPFSIGQNDVSLGRLTVIYGRNGSGKSTLSEYLRSVSNGHTSRSELRGSYFHEASGRVLNGPIPEEVVNDIHVYNRFYVEDNLHAFLSGDGLGDPIVVLGKDNVDAQKDVLEIQATMEVQRQRLKMAQEKVDRASVLSRSAVSRLKTDVIKHLGSVDGITFNTTRFTTTKAEALFLDHASPTLDAQQIADRVAVAGEAEKGEVQIGATPSANLMSIQAEMRTMLGRNVKNISIQALQDDPLLAQWVERGTQLHKSGDVCKFCDNGTVTGETLLRYADHFNESFKKLLAEIDGVGTKVERVTSSLEDVSWIPQADSLLGAFQADFTSAVSAWTDQARGARSWLREIARFLEGFRGDPLGAHGYPVGIDVVPSLDMLSEIESVVEKNNLACAEQLTAKADALNEVQNHCASKHYPAYARANITFANAQRLVVKVETRLRLLTIQENAGRARMSDTNSMASAIDADLKYVFGHDHLNVVVSQDSKGYKIIRRGGVAGNLSEGERHAIALLYFIRSLQRDGVTAEDDLVVVDDPVTSLDKEAMFSAFSLLTNRLVSFGQLVILTHDYEFFRLFLVSKKSAHDASLKRISEGRSHESEFPSIRFLEMVSMRVQDSLHRESVLRSLPNSLLAHPSEYHYLFWRVALAVAEDDEISLPLLGNAARRLLEGFISFRAPDGAGFQEKINATSDLSLPPGEHPSAALVEVKERVTRFAHGASHRGDPSPTTALDFPGIREELKQVLEFMQLCDPQHFERLVKSVGIPPADLQLRLSHRLEVGASFPSYTYGRIEASSALVYAEVLRPNFVVYGTNSPSDLASLISEIPGAARSGIWLVVTGESSDKNLAVDRCMYPPDSVHSVPNLPKGKYRAFFMTSTGEDHWFQDDLHYFECVLRSGYADYGFDSVREGARSVRFAASSDKCDPVLKQLAAVVDTLGRMLDET